VVGVFEVVHASKAKRLDLGDSNNMSPAKCKKGEQRKHVYLRVLSTTSTSISTPKSSFVSRPVSASALGTSFRNCVDLGQVESSVYHMKELEKAGKSLQCDVAALGKPEGTKFWAR